MVEANQGWAFVQMSGVLKRIAVKLSKSCYDLRLLTLRRSASSPKRPFSERGVAEPAWRRVCCPPRPWPTCSVRRPSRAAARFWPEVRTGRWPQRSPVRVAPLVQQHVGHVRGRFSRLAVE
ncbi:hypothetical protein GTY47_26850 [Streptomyces sp. SID5464]|nr:hypothetical protein [Streptomyces sp. SID5464]